MEEKTNFPITKREAAIIQYSLLDLKDKLEVYDKLMSGKGMSRIRNTDDMKQNIEDMKTIQDLIERFCNITGIRA